MTRRRNIFAALALSMVMSCPAFAEKKIDGTVAIVNGEAIMMSEFKKTIDPIMEQYKDAAPEPEQTPEKMKEFKQRLLDQMIDDKLLKQEAVKRKIKVTKRQVEEGVKQVRQRFANETEFNAELKKENLTMPQFEKRIEEQLMVMNLIESEIKAKVTQPSEEETRKLFGQIQSKMEGKELGLDKRQEEELASMAKLFGQATAEQVRARHILVKVGKDASAADKNAALGKIKNIQKELKGGGDFAELAEKYSEDPGSKKRGGDLGYFAKGMMVPDFEKVAFSINVGQVSDPVLTDYGYHLIKVDEKRASKKLGFEDVENDLKQYLYQRNAQVKYEEWLKGIRAKSNIKINPIEG